MASHLSLKRAANFSSGPVLIVKVIQYKVTPWLLQRHSFIEAVP